MSPFVLLFICVTSGIEAAGIPSAGQDYAYADDDDSFGKVNWRQHFMPNEWQPVSDWSRNTPAGRQNAVATVVTESKPPGQRRQLFLLYGGIRYLPDNATWLYSPETDSWRELVLPVRPKVNAFHTMVTLCGETVILFGGETEGSQCCNETWIFAVSERKWKLLQPKIRNNASSRDFPFLTPRCSHAAVVIEQSTSPCHCKQSMLLYGGKTTRGMTFSDLWELRCKSYDDASGFKFEWIFLGNKFPELKKPAAISAFNHTVVYIYGFRTRQKPEMWSYAPANGSWLFVSDRLHYSYISSSADSTTGIYVTDRRNIHVFLACCHQPLVAFDLVQKTWFQPAQEHGKRKLPNLDDSACAGQNEDVMIFGGSGEFNIAKQDALWQLRMVNRDSWVWFLYQSWKLSPLQERSLVTTSSGLTNGNSLFVFGGMPTSSGGPVRFASNDLWHLNVKDMQWTLENNGDGVPMLVAATITVLHDSVVVLFGGCSPPAVGGIFLAYQETWGYYKESKKWNEISTERKPPVRAMHSAVAIDSQTLVIFGGCNIKAQFFPHLERFDGIPLRDVWSLKLPTEEVGANANWSCLSESGPEVSIFHSTVYSDGRLLIYGGAASWFGILTHRGIMFSLSANCSDALWEFSIKSKVWRKLDYVGNAPGPLCLHSSVIFNGYMLITGGCAIQPSIMYSVHTYNWQVYCRELLEGVWSFSLETESWLLLTKNPSPLSQRMLSSAVVWKELILLVGGLGNMFVKAKEQTDISFSAFRPACPAGMMKGVHHSLECTACDLGFYSELEASSECTTCPMGLSTETNQSNAKSKCNVCIRDHCRHGHCRAVLPGPEVDCTCSPGFTKDDHGICSNPTYLLAALGALAGFALLSGIVFVTVRLHTIRKKHKNILRSKEDELIELANVWKIDSRELKMKQSIDTDSPGGFGDVYKADYRDITVAVKRLKSLQRLERIELEFEREIEVMRTIRHPNIVLFIGGGRHHDDGCPFLVVEFMARGSLRSILKKKDVDIPFSLMIRFAVDTARGMRFLHSLRPPRIHRDLKSGNLLVSESWIVKVADFGSARLVKKEAINQDAVRGTGPLSLTEPLLQAEYELSSGVGTTCWSAPEILRFDGYGTPVDVYSFGIVLWEMWTRELPYDDRTFNSIRDLKDAVLSGVRPTVKESCPPSYVSLMTSCWNEHPLSRPTFSGILAKLEQFQDTLFLRDGRAEIVDARNQEPSGP